MANITFVCSEGISQIVAKNLTTNQSVTIEKGADSGVIEANVDDKVSLRASLEEGYVFDGWYENRNIFRCSYETITITVSGRERPFNAIARQGVRIYLDEGVSSITVNGTTFNRTTDISTRAIACAVGSTLAVSATLKDNYAFKGWSCRSNVLANQQQNARITIEESTYLQTITCGAGTYISLSCCDGVSAIRCVNTTQNSDETIEAKTPTNVFVNEGDELIITAWVEVGYDFVGWNNPDLTAQTVNIKATESLLSTNITPRVSSASPRTTLVTVANVALPEPSTYNATTSTIVDSARNVAGYVIGSVVRDDVAKIEMTWRYLTVEQWASILGLFTGVNRFYNEVNFFNQSTGGYTTRTMYVSDRTAGMWRRNPDTGAVMGYTDCRISLIEV